MDSAKRVQSEKARIASQRNIDAYEARQRSDNMLLDNAEVYNRGSKDGFKEGATFGFVLGTVQMLIIAWVIYGMFR